MKRSETVTEQRVVWRCDVCDQLLETENGGETPARMPLAFMPVRGHHRGTFGLFKLATDGFLAGLPGHPFALDLCDHCAGDVSAFLQSRADDNRGSVEA